MFLLTGCGIGGHWMNGNPFPEPITPYLHYWEKAGASPETRREDSVLCEGRRSDTEPFPYEYNKKLWLPNEKMAQARRRLANQWKVCMMEKGYVYTGKCYDTEYTRKYPSPSCKGRVLEKLIRLHD